MNNKGASYPFPYYKIPSLSYCKTIHVTLRGIVKISEILQNPGSKFIPLMRSLSPGSIKFEYHNLR